MRTSWSLSPGLAALLAAVAIPSSLAAQSCQEVSDETTDLLERRLAEWNADLRAGHAVTSPEPLDGQTVVFLSFEVEAVGMSGPGDVATWAALDGRNGAPDVGHLLPVEGLATRLFGPLGGETPVRDSTYPGVEASRACVRDMVGASDPEG